MQRGPLTRWGGVAVTGAAIGLGLAVAGAPSAAAMPAGPAVAPRHGAPFVPAQGDWEGTVNGFAASFELTYDPAMPQRAGLPLYGVRNLVMLRPSACPASPTRYAESIVTGQVPVPLGRYGSLNLGRFRLGGGLTGADEATLIGSYGPGGCHGTLRWRMHPAGRRAVDDGTWTVRYSDGENDRFTVQVGGRLATGVSLPRSVAGCNGLEGSLDMFIGPQGNAAVSQSGVRLGLRFSGEQATGTVTAQGCRGTIGLSATRAGG